MESRKAAQANGEGRWQRFRAVGGPGSVLLAAAFFALALAMDAWPLEPVPFRPGGYVPRDVYARVPFRTFSQAATTEQRERAARTTPAVIRSDEPALQRIVADLKDLPARLKAATQPADLPEPFRERFGVRTQADLTALAPLAGAAGTKAYAQQVDRLAEKLLARHIVPDSVYYRAKDVKGVKVGVRLRDRQQVIPFSALLNVDSSRDLNAFLAAATADLDPAVRNHVLHCLQQTFAAGAAIFRLDEEATAAAEALAKKRVGPVMEMRSAGELIVARTVRRRLDRTGWEALASEHRAFVTMQNERNPLRPAWLLLGRAVMIGGIVVLLSVYVCKYRPRIVQNHWRGLTVAALLAVLLLVSRAAIGVNPYLTVFGVFLAAVILAIAYDQRFAFAVGGALALLMVLQLRLGMAQLLVLLAALSASAFLLREVRTRSKLIETGGIAAAVAFVATWAVSVAEGVPARFILEDSGTAAVAAVTGGFIAQGILPVVERIFGIATSLTLLEWCDANKPLLKRLALETPGTYSHSLLLGSMSEAAAEAIGARGLLARVGAYYHDVGKINKPPYFGENQPGPASPHDRLSPAMSLLVVKGHVKDGLELARHYGLPRVLHEFIATHHGTTLVEYFYHAAAAQRKEDVERAPDEVEFRYPGPKPRSREAAILMLADAAESSVRAMPEPTPGRIETQVHQVVSKRLTDGQLDECELRLQEVHGIERSLTKSLVSMYHGRVQYPSQKPAEDSEDKPNGGPNGKGNGKAPAPAAPAG